MQTQENNFFVRVQFLNSNLNENSIIKQTNKMYMQNWGTKNDF